jgi:hypothetical protein
VKDRATGHYTTVYDDYLEVKWRLVMFRERYPHGVITTEEVCVDLDRAYARYRAVVETGARGPPGARHASPGGARAPGRPAL